MGDIESIMQPASIMKAGFQHLRAPLYPYIHTYKESYANIYTYIYILTHMHMCIYLKIYINTQM